MGNIFSFGGSDISEDECGTGDHMHKKWVDGKCSPIYKNCGSGQVYNPSSYACEDPSSADATSFVQCPAGQYTTNGVDCQAFPVQSVNLDSLKLKNTEALTLFNSLNSCGAGSDFYFDNTKETGKCVSCTGSNEIIDTENGLSCVCSDGYTRNGAGVCTFACGANQRETTATDGSPTCECLQGYTPVMQGDKLIDCVVEPEAFTNPVTGKKMSKNEQMMLLLLIIVLLYVYRRQVKNFVNRTSRSVRRR